MFDIYQSDPKNSNNKSTYTRTSMITHANVPLHFSIFISFVHVLTIRLVLGPPEYAKPPTTYDVDPNTQLTTIVPIQSATGSVSGTTDVWFQLAYASEASYPSLSPSPSLLLPSPLLSYFRTTGINVVSLTRSDTNSPKMGILPLARP